MESRIDQPEIQASSPNQFSRHIMLSSLRGVITEMERIGVPELGDQYILRLYRASEEVGRVLDAGIPSDPMSWVGFRFRDANWSFVKQGRL